MVFMGKVAEMMGEGCRGFRLATAAAILLPALLAAPAPELLAAPGFAEVLAGMQARLAVTADYRCRLETWSTDGHRSRAVVLAYAFRQPAKIRMEVLEGPYAGSLLLYDRESDPARVRARAGNPLLAALQRMLHGEYFAVDHRWMVDMRGGGVHESHWPYMADAYRRYLKGGTSRFLGEDTVDGRLTYRYRLERTEPEPPASIKTEEIWVDASSYFPFKYLQYDTAGRLVRQAVMTEVQFNTDIAPEWFKEFHPRTD